VFAAALWAAPGGFAAGWCGSGESPIDRPDATTGRQFHAVVAIPSDAPDTFAADANRMADDVASIESWWQSQDATRIPRFDTAVFSGASCLDISFLRLPSPASSYPMSSDSDASLTFTTLLRQLQQAGMQNQYKKYLVYVDGIGTGSDLICGTGEGEFDTGPAYALVWLPTCEPPGQTPVSKDQVAAHELLHSLGALPSGAPHACPGDSGHPCDSTTDVLYPYTAGLPLASYVLDYNHDDYYGHPGSWPDIQDSLWLHPLNLPPQPLTVNITGGLGGVDSDVPGVACTANCTTQWDLGSKLNLLATASKGYRFVHWSGAGCTGNTACTLAMSATQSVSAVFGPARVALQRTAVGRGRIACSPACGASVPAGAPLILRAVPAKGWKFVGWAGACRGSVPLCQPKTDTAVSVRARFAKKPAVKKKR
jgi:hypothetical protein